MNSWNYNEVTQSDLYDFKACKHNVTGKIYGIKDSATCQQGKEIDTKDIDAMVKKANAGDLQAKKQLEAYRKAQSDSKKATNKAKEEAAKKKKEAEEQKGKKGKGGGKGKKGGGKGKKGGGKGKAGGKGKGAAKKGGGKAGKGGGKGKAEAKPSAARSKANDVRAQQQAKKAAMQRARDTVKNLQKMLREVSDPKAKQQIQKAIGELLTSVVEAAKADMGGDAQKPAAGAGSIAGQVKGEAAKNEKAVNGLRGFTKSLWSRMTSPVVNDRMVLSTAPVAPVGKVRQLAMR